MEAKTTIRRMLSGNFIRVPNYQRAYSWDKDKQVRQFLIDLDDYIDSGSTTPYYFGHFLFEQKSEDLYNIIDGQQRLTTIEIFLSSVFKRLASIRSLIEDDKKIIEDGDKRKIFWNEEVLKQSKIKQPYISERAKELSMKGNVLSIDEFINEFKK